MIFVLLQVKFTPCIRPGERNHVLGHSMYIVGYTIRRTRFDIAKLITTAQTMERRSIK